LVWFTESADEATLDNESVDQCPHQHHEKRVMPSEKSQQTNTNDSSRHEKHGRNRRHANWHDEYTSRREV